MESQEAVGNCKNLWAKLKAFSRQSQPLNLGPASHLQGDYFVSNFSRVRMEPRRFLLITSWVTDKNNSCRTWSCVISGFPEFVLQYFRRVYPLEKLSGANWKALSAVEHLFLSLFSNSLHEDRSKFVKLEWIHTSGWHTCPKIRNCPAGWNCRSKSYILPESISTLQYDSYKLCLALTWFLCVDMELQTENAAQWWWFYML